MKRDQLNLKIFVVLQRRIVVSRSAFAAHRACLSCLEQHMIEGDNPVRGNACALAMCFQRVGLFGNAAQNGW